MSYWMGDWMTEWMKKTEVTTLYSKQIKKRLSNADNKNENLNFLILNQSESQMVWEPKFRTKGILLLTSFFHTWTWNEKL